MTILRSILRPVLRPILRSPLQPGGGAAAPSFNPATLFALGEKGMWLDQSDSATGFTDSTGLTSAVLNDPIGRRSDKSGRTNHAKQATSAARPLWKQDGAIYSDLFDGFDDGYATAAFAAGTLTADMDYFVAIKRTSAAIVIHVTKPPASGFFGCFVDADASLTYNNCGTPTIAVNGVAVAGGTATTRDQLSDAMPVGSWLILEYRNLDLSAWDGLILNGYPGANAPGNIGGVILCPAQSADNRTKIRQYLANKVGVTL